MLELKSLHKKYQRKDLWAVQDLSLQVPQGELLALLGESGSGKTTLLRLIAGFEVPERGEIILNGIKVVGPHTYVQPEKRRIGMVFQDYALFPHLTVKQNIAFGLKNKEAKVKESTIQELLQLVGLSEQAKKYPHQLSGGQHQRVALARALAPRPDILLLDEPFSNLDEVLKEQMRREMRRIIKESRITALFVTHDTRDALTTADRIILLKEGSMQQAGSPQEVYQQPVNTYVAGFFGQINLIQARPEGRGYQSLLGFIETSTPPLQQNQVRLCIRPEHIMLCRPEEALFSGTVAEVTYLGSHCRLHLQTAAGLLTLQISSLLKVTPGEILYCTIKKDYITALSA